MGSSITQADGALIPIALLAVEWLPIFRGPDIMADLPKLTAYGESIARDPLAQRLIVETRDALRRQMGSTSE